MITAQRCCARTSIYTANQPSSKAQQAIFSLDKYPLPPQMTMRLMSQGIDHNKRTEGESGLIEGSISTLRENR
jgi:hypothetical protein